MTRKRRKTRSRQERRRIHARTRQTFEQATAKYDASAHTRVDWAVYRDAVVP